MTPTTPKSMYHEFFMSVEDLLKHVPSIRPGVQLVDKDMNPVGEYLKHVTTGGLNYHVLKNGSGTRPFDITSTGIVVIAVYDDGDVKFAANYISK